MGNPNPRIMFRWNFSCRIFRNVQPASMRREKSVAIGLREGNSGDLIGGDDDRVGGKIIYFHHTNAKLFTPYVPDRINDPERVGRIAAG